MWQVLCKGTVSVRLAVPAISYCSSVWCVCCFGLGQQPGEIDRLLHCRRSAAVAPQQDVRQKMQALPRCRLMSEAERRLGHTGFREPT